MTSNSNNGRARSWLALVLAACIIAPLSESLHGLMLDRLHVPYPSTPGLPSLLRVLDLGLRLAAAAFCVRFLLAQRWRDRPFATAAFGSILMLLLNETLRVIFIVSAIGQSLPAALLNALPALLIGVNTAIIVYAAASRMRWPSLGICILAVSAFSAMYISPRLVAQVEVWNQTYFSRVVNHYNPPYPAFIQFRISAGFLEPTFATFVLLWLCWSSLPAGVWRRVVWFTIFLLVLRGRVTSLLLFSFWVRQPFPINFLSESQFFLETATLAVLASLIWAYCSPRATNDSSVPRGF